jgi:hypothetical protein
MRMVLIAVVLFCALLGCPSDAVACSCMGGIPLCETFWKTPVVFSGEVLEIELIPRGSQPASLLSRIVRFRVDDVWRGNVSGVIEVQTGSGAGDCGYAFQKGVRYLVFAHERGGVLSTGICSPTKPLAEASADLAYVRQPFPPSAGGRIIGTATDRPMILYGGPPQPLARYTVVLSNGQREWRTTTNADGKYEFTGIPAGKYDVKLLVPPTEHVYGPVKTELVDPRGCAGADFYVVPNGRVAVRVLNADGSPASNVMIEIVQADKLREPFFSTRTATTSEYGIVELSELPPDRYVLGVNLSAPVDLKRPYGRTFYPGVGDPSEAKVIDMGRGERVELDPFVLPAPLRELTLSGVVQWPDGSVAAKASVVLRSGGGRPCSGRQVGSLVATTADGRFRFQAHAGQRYCVSTFINVGSGDSVRQWHATSSEFELKEDSQPLTLVLQPPSERR